MAWHSKTENDNNRNSDIFAGIEDKISILIIEDNPGDIGLIQETLKTIPEQFGIDIIRNGEDALKFFRKEGDYRGATLPDLILMDINLPIRDGWEILGILKHDPILRKIPVVILTCSESQVVINRMYDQYANSYVIKPMEYESFSDTIIAILRYWLTVVRLPTHSNS